jgi:lysozyme
VTLFGIDVSHHQSLNPADVFGTEEAAFVVARTSHGTVKDLRFEEYQRFAESKGVLFAAYHYVSGLSSPREQALVIREQLDLASDVPVILDVEPTEGQRNPTMDTVRAISHELGLLGAGVTSLLYFPEWFWIQIGRPSTTPWSIWQSDYGDNSGVYPGDLSARWMWGSKEAVMLQYTSRGRVPGYSGNIDRNAYRGTREQLAATGWFKDYKDDDVATQAEIQAWVANTPITVNLETKETKTLQWVLRTLLSRASAEAAEVPTPPVDVDAVAAAVVAALPDDEGQVPSLSQDEVEEAVKQALREGIGTP